MPAFDAGIKDVNLNSRGVLLGVSGIVERQTTLIDAIQSPRRRRLESMYLQVFFDKVYARIVGECLYGAAGQCHGTAVQGFRVNIPDALAVRAAQLGARVGGTGGLVLVEADDDGYHVRAPGVGIAIISKFASLLLSRSAPANVRANG